MPQKSKARASSRKTDKASIAKTQSERFIETARALGVDESGKEFERALRRIIPQKRKAATI
jgi:ABC-type dipeptide/oligopeptide/nickel transport system permease component